MTNSCNDLLGNNNCAEVVGSTPTQSIFICYETTVLNELVFSYCLSNSAAVQIGHTAPILWIDFKATKTPQLSLKGEIEVRKLKVDRT
jgi:hypothetical protein